MPRLLVLVVALVSVWLTPALGWATGKVVLATDGPRRDREGLPSGDAVEDRVLDDLIAQGHDVTVVAWDIERGNDPAWWVRGKARKKGGRYGVAIRVPRNGKDPAYIWFYDRETDRTRRRTLEPFNNTHSSTRISRAVLSLVGHDPAAIGDDADHAKSEPPTGPVNEAYSNPILLEKPKPPKYRWAADVEGGVLWPVKMKQVMGVMRFGFGYLPDRHSWVGGEVMVPLSPFTTENDNGRLRSLLVAFGVRGTYDLLQERPPYHLDVIGALNAAAVVVDASPAAGVSGKDETLWTGFGSLGLRFRVSVNRFDFGITGRVDAPFVYRRPRLGDERVQDFSIVWIEGLASFRVKW